MICPPSQPYHAVIIGGGEVGVETGLHLAQKGKRVTVIEVNYS